MAPITKNTLEGHSGGCHSSLSSFMHPHALNLVDYTGTADRSCDVCGDHADGLVYQCKGCEFDVHPICTSFPRELNHVLHPNHKLVYQAFVDRPCAVCGGVCTRWRYRCAGCGFDIHPECVLVKLRDLPASRAQGPQRPPPPAYAANGIPYGYGGYNPCYPFNNFVPNMQNQFANFHPAPFHIQYNFADSQPPHNLYNYGNFPAQGGNVTSGSSPGRKIFEIVRSLALGVLSNVIFGLAFS